jgi:hypothetical protein
VRLFSWNTIRDGVQPTNKVKGQTDPVAGRRRPGITIYKIQPLKILSSRRILRQVHPLGRMNVFVLALSKPYEWAQAEETRLS